MIGLILVLVKAVIEKINDFDMLSDEAKHLTKKIYDFIDVNSK